MTEEELLKAKSLFRERIESLKSDLRICQQGAFFPIVMYTFATIDYFSSFWVGWNDPKGENRTRSYNRDRRNQTERMVYFMKKYMNYPVKSSRIAIAIFRHKLMHTAEPRVITARNKKERYYWKITFDLDINHFLPQRVADDPNDPGYEHYDFCISVPRLISDIENSIFGPQGYFYDLLSSEDLQGKYKTCENEFNNYKVDL
jgi:hypothetical protein